MENKMTDTKKLKSEIAFLRGSMREGSNEIATDCWFENMQAVADLANEMRYQCEFGESYRGKIPVTMTPRTRLALPVKRDFK